MSKKEFNKEAKSNLAKLLATENITVEHRKVQTAFFDLGKRLLVVPIWKEMNVDILDMLLAHEIGHALFTPQDEWKEGIDKKIPHSYLNIVEDARIEKLIKRKYPGLSQPFIKGYRDLINNDFFKTKDKDINEMLLIHRLNMHFTKKAKAKKKMIMGKTQQIRTAKKSMLQVMIILILKLMLLGQMLKTIY